MRSVLKFDGIYDLRTFSYLKSKEIKNFGFDFSPKSFNFLQTKIFLNEIVPKLDGDDHIFLKFDHVFDPMVDMLLSELQRAHIERENIFFNFNFFDKNYFLHKLPKEKITYPYEGEFFSQVKTMESLAVVVIEHERIQELEKNGVLFNFVTNFYASTTESNKGKKQVEVRLNWDIQKDFSFIDLLDVDYISFQIDSNVETCYRNVDLKRLDDEIESCNKLLF